MKTVTIHVFICMRREAWETDPQFFAFSSDMKEYGYVPVCERELDITLPEGFNPIASQISALEEQIEAARDAFHVRQKEIQDQIQKLQALPAPVEGN